MLLRAFGCLSVSETSCQAMPSHSQVSLLSRLGSEGVPTPPNITTLPRTLSYAIPAEARACGPSSAIWVHVLPSHSHVSPSRTLFLSAPPNRTSQRRAES